MSYALARARYADATAQTVSPVRLLTMLYDRLVSDLASAEDAIRRRDFETTGNRIGRAQEILFELRSSLNTELWPAGEALGALYLWIIGELTAARLDQSPERVAACRELVEPLRDTWQAAALEAAGADDVVETSVSGPMAVGLATLGGVA